MITKNERVNYDRYNKLAFQLNHEAYLQQMDKNGGRKLKQFVPCAKAVILTASLSKRPIPVTSEVIPVAGKTACSCHSGLNENDLYKMLLGKGE